MSFLSILGHRVSWSLWGTAKWCVLPILADEHDLTPPIIWFKRKEWYRAEEKRKKRREESGEEQ